MVKRVFDVLVSLIGLTILAFPLLLFAVVVRVDSPGPAFFLQERVGKDFKFFKLFKFRTMRIDSDRHSAITIGRRDPRITRIGFVLRKLKLDELPQLLNVLLGDMSLVGPRPELKRFVDLYSDDQRRVLSVRPGITDYASIRFRNENQLLEGKEDPISFYVNEIMPEKLQLNLKYIDEQSFWTDLQIIWTTVILILKKG